MFEEDSGSGGSSEFEKSSDEDYDGDDVIDFENDDDDKPVKKSSIGRSNRKSSSQSKKSSKKAKDPNAPKKPQTAFFLWLNENRESIKKENPDAGLGQIGKIAGEKWREISDEDKQEYNDKYKIEKEKYDEAMKSYKPTGEFAKSSRGSSKSSKKDPNAPKKPQSSYFLWMNDNRARIKEENPSAGLTDIARLSGAQWKEISDSEKAKYEEKNKQDKERYAEEMKNYVPPKDSSPAVAKKSRKSSGSSPSKIVKKAKVSAQSTSKTAKSKEFISDSDSSSDEMSD